MTNNGECKEAPNVVKYRSTAIGVQNDLTRGGAGFCCFHLNFRPRWADVCHDEANETGGEVHEVQDDVRFSAQRGNVELVIHQKIKLCRTIYVVPNREMYSNLLDSVRLRSSMANTTVKVRSAAEEERK